LGNNDTDIPGLTSTFNRIHGELKGEIFESVYDGMKFAVYHGTNLAKKHQLIKSGKYDVFIYGHTHRKDNRYIGITRVINPGTAKGWFFGLFATIAVFDTSSRSLEFINLMISSYRILELRLRRDSDSACSWSCYLLFNFFI
ncbi:MAG: metallophosphoesterase family protein, partial [Nitrososphaeraceae archaeon]|nr:metallophosphoesterase family protein [Nitrososphaeraceae archaeon]